MSTRHWSCWFVQWKQEGLNMLASTTAIDSGEQSLFSGDNSAADSNQCQQRYRKDHSGWLKGILMNQVVSVECYTSI